MYKYVATAAFVLFPFLAFGAVQPENQRDVETTQGITGKELLHLCAAFANKANEPSGNYTLDDYYCLGFISGAVESQHFISFYKAIKSQTYRSEMSGEEFNKLMSKHHLFCLTSKVYLKDLVPIVVSYAKGHPEILEYPAGVLLYSALSEKFPCAEK